MKLAKHDLVAALSLRYDHYSAQNLFEAACKNAGLTDQTHYTASEVAAFRAALGKLGDRLQRVDERLDSLLGEPANVPQDPTPMPAATEPAPVKTDAAPAPANVPQDATPMPAAKPTEQQPPPANVPQDATPMPAASEPAPAKADAKPAPANVPQDATPMPAADGKATRIILSGVELDDGEKIYVCGDRPELGSWDPDRARPLTREGDAWSTSIEPGSGEFKFLRRTADGKVTWEGGENREIGTAVKIETSWQS